MQHVLGIGTANVHGLAKAWILVKIFHNSKNNAFNNDGEKFIIYSFEAQVIGAC
jgi:hypothetical protein